MNKNIFVGVDVGKNGGVFAMYDDGVVIVKEAIPKLKGEDEVDYVELLHIFRHITRASRRKAEAIVIIEDVHSLYGMSAKSNFTFGHIKGVKEAMMVALDYDYRLIPPKKWQNLVWKDEDVVYETTKAGKKKKDTKATSLKAAQRLFPAVDFTRSARAKKPHDGIVDAALMAEYARLTESED